MTLVEIADVKLGSAPKRAGAKKPAKDEPAEGADAAEAAE
jgi:hypothetical protein